MEQFKIFIVEDEPWYGELLKYHLSLNPDYEIHLFTTGRACLENLHRRPDVICLDYQLPDMNGGVLLSKIQANDRSIQTIVISGQEQVSIALQLLKNGAYDYLVKDDNTRELLWNTIVKIRENASLKKEVESLKNQLEKKFTFEKVLIGQSPALKNTFTLIERALSSNINVLVTGETGTGKEMVAKMIHYNSSRKKKPFVAVNLAAIPKELIESELFGHEKGAFTGTTGRRIGKFEEAQGGTIFLDEIAELDLNLQVKLLRVLQEREVVRVGGNETIKLDVRIISATHKKLRDQVRAGNFREDLFYRILGLPIELPPLRERGKDILVLAKHFVEEFVKANRTSAIRIGEGAKDKLQKYNYPGNVRELKAIIELACVMSNGGEIRDEDISYPSVGKLQEFTAVEKTLDEYNFDIIKFYLRKYNENVVLVANKLGIGKSTIYNMLKKQ